MASGINPCSPIVPHAPGDLTDTIVPANRWLGSVAYRWFQSDRRFVGGVEQPQRQAVRKQRLAVGSTSTLKGASLHNPTNGVTFLGEGIGNNGQLTPVLVNVFAETAGVYPLRFIFQDVALSSAYITLYTIKANGDNVLLGDVANGGLKAYRVGQVPGPALYLAASLVSGQPRISWTEPGVVLQESTNLTSWVNLPTTTSPYTPAPPGHLRSSIA